MTKDEKSVQEDRRVTSRAPSPNLKLRSDSKDESVPRQGSVEAAPINMLHSRAQDAMNDRKNSFDSTDSVIGNASGSFRNEFEMEAQSSGSEMTNARAAGKDDHRNAGFRHGQPTTSRLHQHIRTDSPLLLSSSRQSKLLTSSHTSDVDTGDDEEIESLELWTHRQPRDSKVSRLMSPSNNVDIAFHESDSDSSDSPGSGRLINRKDTIANMNNMESSDSKSGPPSPTDSNASTVRTNKPFGGQLPLKANNELHPSTSRPKIDDMIDPLAARRSIVTSDDSDEEIDFKVDFIDGHLIVVIFLSGGETDV